VKVLHTEASCGWGGQEIRILEESSGFITRGHEVCIACPKESRIFEEASKRGIPTYAAPIRRKNLKGLMALRRWLKSNPPDVINTHSSTDTWLAVIACRTLYSPPPIVRTRHISSPIPNNWASRWLYSKGANHVVTTGKALREQVIKQTGTLPSRVTSIPTGIDPYRFKPSNKHEARVKLQLDPNKKYIGIVATLRSWKGHLYLLDAFARLNPSNCILLIVGDGPMQEPIRKRIDDLNISKHVQLVGQKTNPEEWLQALDVFCLPSYANEGVPQAIIQAMFTGLPIVTTPVGAILEAVKDDKSALIVPPKNSPAIAQAIEKILTNPNLGSRLAGAAINIARSKFSYEQMLDKMLAIHLEQIQ
jgi:glycosyltransferase involved in cell wall biosynthesis